MGISTFHIYCVLKVTIACIIIIDLLTVHDLSYNYVSAEEISPTNHKKPSSTDISELCSDCRLTSNSVDDLVRRPRQMDSYGIVEDRRDLDKIKKAVCKDIANDADRERCRNFYFTNQESIQKWGNLKTRITFHDFVCIKDLKYCCPVNSFGPKCTKCLSCGPNEYCHGDGTRSGNGTCICKQGYIGAHCSSCSNGFYSLKEGTRQRSVCKPCHKSCLHCRGEGPLNCEVCKAGYSWEPGFGCSDIDECIKSNNKICGDNTFCVNTDGSYFCYECDRACDGCHGDGPDMCLKCSKDYELKNGICSAMKKTILTPGANYHRYAIYVGLCISTCIIFHNNVYFASVVGLGVAIYMGASEYIMSNHELDMREKEL